MVSSMLFTLYGLTWRDDEDGKLEFVGVISVCAGIASGVACSCGV